MQWRSVPEQGTQLGACEWPRPLPHSQEQCLPKFPSSIRPSATARSCLPPPRTLQPTSVAPRFSMVVMRLARMSSSYSPTQFMYCGLRRMSSGVRRPSTRGPVRDPTPRGSITAIVPKLIDYNLIQVSCTFRWPLPPGTGLVWQQPPRMSPRPDPLPPRGLGRALLSASTSNTVTPHCRWHDVLGLH